MASDLLKTFKKIDLDRKLMIQLLNGSGLNIPEDGSFSDIIDALTTFELSNEFDINLGWVRPSYWPDSKEILNEAPHYEGYFPYAVALMDDSLDSVILPLSSRLAARLIYTSDGTLYQYQDVDEGIEHTWDKTKDIIIDKNNPMRYIVLYADLSRISNYGYSICYPSGTYNDVYSPLYKSNKEDKGWGNCIVEWLLDVREAVPGSTSNYTNNVLLPFNNSNSKNTKVSSITISEVVSKKMKLGNLYNIDNFYNLRYLNTAINSSSSAGFSYTKLSTYINTSISTYNVIHTARTVTYVEFPTMVYLANGNSSSCGSLSCNLRLPKAEVTNQNSSLYAKTLYAPKLKTINNDPICIGSNILYLPVLETSFTTILRHIIPIVILPNLKTLQGKIASDMDNKPAHTIIVPNLSSISDKEAFNFEGLINLEVGKDFNSNINLNKTSLSKTSLLNLLNNLAEVPAENGLTLTLGNLIYSLTDEEKAIATNKGWVINQ
ncbi:MAG: hypothetical protein IKB64_05190 [Paludibacteraceae bacterium]|nr:hypothetical protein [Paludibacteraceae bacterium]